MRKFIKLVNNERMNRRITSEKANTCIGTNQDVCASQSYDYAHCEVGSYDLCVKDFAACVNNSIDYCNGERDVHACIGFNSTDLI